MTSITHGGIAETRQYNALYQLTRITVAGQMDLEYRYSATANNGQITQMKNWMTGEEVNYSYDAVGRLTAAATTGVEWGLTFTYDGFGNKTGQGVTKGSGPAMSVGVDGSNRVVGWTYDAAGFPTAVAGQYTSMNWDAQGRMQGITAQAGNTDNFVYDTGNRRVWRNNQLHLRGVDGKVVALFNYNSVAQTFDFVDAYAWFAGRKVGQKEDRLGTVQNGSRFYPYGEESASTGNDKEKFATYWRDSNTGLDYAVNRYYKANVGRFRSPAILRTAQYTVAPSVLFDARCRC
ncbi:MAG: hypothetical protein JNK48_24150 [Bryobacterales bacterium]|nr:hypothetical protein [Bryobacterales bacterium]